MNEGKVAKADSDLGKRSKGGDPDKLPLSGQVITGVSGKDYKLGSQLGDGGYGVVFVCDQEKENRRVAVKVEKWSRSSLQIELEVLKKAKEKGCRHFCRVFDHGGTKPSFSFLVMSLLNRDLHRLRIEQTNRRFSKNTALRVGIQSLEAIRELHGFGFISRDIKPGNFAPGLRENSQHRAIFIFDFGLARKHLDKKGVPVPQRKDVGWRGTNRYGSLEAHRRHDLSRRDDVESWFYLVVEVTKGTLPWRQIGVRNDVFESKKKARESAGRALFLADCPSEFDEMLKKVDEMKYEDEPDYSFFTAKLTKICMAAKIEDDDLFDWDDEVSTQSTCTTHSQSSFSDRRELSPDSRGTPHETSMPGEKKATAREDSRLKKA